jgi:uncharacterized protein YbaR (Trm112 family)
MKRRLLQWLVCPLCQGELRAVVAKDEHIIPSEVDCAILESIQRVRDRDEIETEILTGALTCASCRVYYPIHNGVPRMLTYSTQIAEVHALENEQWVRERLAGFTLPNTVPPPGENCVLQNFSEEWTNYKWSGSNYWSTTVDNMLQLMRFCLGVSKHELRGKLLLDVGIGIGGIANSLSIAEDCEIVGMDLGYAVDSARKYFGRNARLHIVQASLFAPPFRPKSFDVVYSQGVLHHTYSTHDAFLGIAPLTKADGMLYVWVYSNEDEEASLLRRMLMALESGIRPLLAKLPNAIRTAALVPTLPVYIAYQNLYRRRRIGALYAPRYSWNAAMHAARDRLTPPFAYRHSYEEVAAWFRSAGYQYLEMLRDEPLPQGVPRTVQMCVGIRGFRGTPDATHGSISPGQKLPGSLKPGSHNVTSTA